MRRVVVTGLGMLTPVGLTVEDTWSAIVQGKSGIATIEKFDASHLSTTIAGELKGFSSDPVIPAKDAKRMDPFSQYGVVAAHQAWVDSGIDLSQENPHRIGVAVGAGMGGMSSFADGAKRYMDGSMNRVSPFFIPATIINIVAGHISILLGLKGPNVSVVSACTTGTHNIGIAARMVAYGDADVMVAGGCEMVTHELGIAGFSAARALSSRNDEPQRASRPWDVDRDGFVLSEGAGILILEEYEHAKRRGAKIYAELIGYAMSSDAHHITAPDPNGEGFVACMTGALEDAQIAPTEIDYINAHGTSTQLGDVIEAAAVKQAFGKHAYDLAISSTKSMIGHLIGAAGAVEAIFSILAIRDQIAPPTINLDNPCPECDLNFVPHEAQRRTINTTLSNSFGFGGTNATVVFRRFHD